MKPLQASLITAEVLKLSAPKPVNKLVIGSPMRCNVSHPSTYCSLQIKEIKPLPVFPEKSLQFKERFHASNVHEKQCFNETARLEAFLPFLLVSISSIYGRFIFCNALLVVYPSLLTGLTFLFLFVLFLLNLL